MNINMSTVVTYNPEIAHSDMDGEVVMMSVTNGEYYGIDAIGSHIWKLLEDKISIGDICATLHEAYDVSEDQCKQDVMAFINHLLEIKVVLID